MKVNGVALTGVLLIAAGSALSQDVSAAEPAVEVTPSVSGDIWATGGGVRTWGDVEAGFRAFIERPPAFAYPGIWPSGRPTQAGTPSPNPAGGLPPPIFPTDRDNRAKFEEYGDINPGFFFEKLVLGAQTKDGTYETELRADNIGNNNQRFVWDWSKSGEYYSTFVWDQIPHLYSTSALSIWNGVGTNFLTTPVEIGAVANATLGATQTVYDQLEGNLKVIDIGIQRDKFATAQRWTPNQNWDVRADYSHEHRDGTQPGSAVIGGMGAQQIVQLPVPIDDVTQNAKLSGQYSGDTQWGGKFNIRTSAAVSSYQNQFDSYTFENPFAASIAPAQTNLAYCAQKTTSANYPLCGRVSLPPDNQAYNFATTAGVDLPNNSRYMSTVSYTMMRQDDPFIDRTINPNIPPVGDMLYNSANAKVDTLLVNNVLTTQITKDLKSTLRYRYYDNDNNTPEIYWPQYNQEDATSVATRRRNLAYSYTKQNASEELTWRANRNVTFGAVAGWEQYDRDRRSVDVTDEYSGKAYVNVRLADTLSFRSSYQYAQRTYNDYDFTDVAYFQFNDVGTGVTNLMMRQLDLADRTRQKASALLEWSPVEKLTITPSFGLRFDDYGTDPFPRDNAYNRANDPAINPNYVQIGELGLLTDNNWNAGIEVSYAFAPGTTMMLAYVHEEFDRSLIGGFGSTNWKTLITSAAGGGAPGYFFSKMTEKVDTIIATANIELVPDTLDLKLSYAYAFGDEDWSAEPWSNSPNNQCPIPPKTSNACEPFPTVRTDYQRLDAVLKYTLDPNLVAKMGFDGTVALKLRYAWEFNDVTNWQNDWTTPYMYLVDGSMVRNISMAAYNPNYNAQLIAASLSVKW